MLRYPCHHAEAPSIVPVLAHALPQHRHRRRYEKETKLRELMKMMGMQMKMYWALNFVYDFVMYLVVILLFTLARHTAATVPRSWADCKLPPKLE